MDVESTSAAAPSQGAAPRRPIGEFLVERGLVTEGELKQALAEQRSSGKRLGEILVERGAITRMALASVLGEQWEEAGRHLRAVVPVRLAGGKEADAGLAGGEELTDSLASLQAAVARLEELSGGPGGERVIVGDEAIEASLAGLGRQLAELRDAVAAPMVVETDHLGARLAELDAFLRGRDEESGARVEAAVESLGSRVDEKLSELAEAASHVPVIEPDPGIGERLDRIDAWLREARVELPAAIDPELGDRLGRVEALLTERAGAADAVSPELARRLDEIEAAAKRPTVDLAPIEQRLDALDASVTEALAAPVAEAPTEALLARLEALEQSLGAVRSAVEAPREDSVGEALLARFGGLEEALGARDRAWEAAVERLGRLEESVREAVARPDGTALGDELVARLEELRNVVAGLDGSAGAARSAELAERFGSLEQRLESLRAAVEASRGDAVGERLGHLEESIREALARPVAPGGDDAAVLARLEELGAAIAGLDGSAGAAVDSPRDDRVAERLASLEQVLGNRDLAWEAAVERLGRLEESVREAVARPEHNGVGEAVLGRLDALRDAVDARDRSGRFESVERSLHELRALLESPRDDMDRFAGVEHALRDLQAALESPRDDGVAERLASVEQVLGGRDLAWEAAVERLGRLEETIREASARREDDRLDDVLARLGELQQSVSAPGDDEVLRRFEEVAHTIREASAPGEDDRLDDVLARLGDLRHAVDAPSDGAILQRLDGLEHTIREATLSREDGRLDEALARLEAVRSELASGHESRLTIDDVRALLDEQRQALDRPDRSAETIGLLRKLARESAESSDALAERLGAALTDGLADLRAAVEQPRDTALHERLDRIDAALAGHDSSREPLAELARRLDALEPIKAALDELCSTAAEPAGARFLERLVTRSHNQIAERIGELEQALHTPGPGPDASALAERDARIAELVEQLNVRPAQTPAPADDRPRPGDTTSFLALVPASDGYRLVAFEGTLPAAGDGLAVPDDDRALVVARLGRSPYPGDARPCAYLQAS